MTRISLVLSCNRLMSNSDIILHKRSYKDWGDKKMGKKEDKKKDDYDYYPIADIVFSLMITLFIAKPETAFEWITLVMGGIIGGVVCNQDFSKGHAKGTIISWILAIVGILLCLTLDHFCEWGYLKTGSLPVKEVFAIIEGVLLLLYFVIYKDIVTGEEEIYERNLIFKFIHSFLFLPIFFLVLLPYGISIIVYAFIALGIRWLLDLFLVFPWYPLYPFKNTEFSIGYFVLKKIKKLPNTEKEWISKKEECLFDRFCIELIIIFVIFVWELYKHPLLFNKLIFN